MEADKLRWKYLKFDDVIKMTRICTLPDSHRVYAPVEQQRGLALHQKTLANDGGLSKQPYSPLLAYRQGKPRVPAVQLDPQGWQPPGSPLRH